MMNIKNNIAVWGAFLALLTSFSACQSEKALEVPTPEKPAYTVGQADNAIVLTAGISEGASGVQTRTAYGTAEYTDFTADTGLNLYIEGTWLNHVPVQVIKYPVASINGSADSGHKSAVQFAAAQQPYWDDYGTADPANMPSIDGNGRDKGLTIYAAAVNGETTAPTVAENAWEALSWTLDANQQTNNWTKKDLLISNNVTGGNTYKFGAKSSGKLLEFTHAMTKITINFTAGKGFPGYETNEVNAQFQNDLTVLLKSFYYTGTVNVKTKDITETTTGQDVTPRKDTGGKDSHTAQFTALVYPDQVMAENQSILEFMADGNKFFVNANTLRTKMSETTGHNGEYKLEKGVNYILNITVNKTKIEVEATIKAWQDVDTAIEEPVINVDQSYGTTTGSGISTFGHSYDFFRSETKATGYDEDKVADGIRSAATYTYNSGTGTGTWDKTLYWPNHNTHYFFRGVSPVLDTAVTGTGTSLSALAVTTTSNSNDIVEVENVKYTENTYPSDLAIAMPRSTSQTCQHGKTDDENGICATKGTVTMNFEYAMSKVQVSLKSTGTDEIGNLVNLTNVSVEIIGGYKKARIKLSDGLHDDYTDADKENYTLNKLTTSVTGFTVSTLDAIVPQVLGDDVKFRITVTNSDSSIDVYEAQINKIKVKNTETPVGEWEHGKFYKYELDIKKTEVKVTATITDWVTVNATENVWF